jgi:purine-cytosine permease-like protein
MAITALTTAGALWLNIADYENFLTLIGSVFVPLSAVLVIDYYVIARGNWDLSQHAGTRWRSLAAWAVGFIVYQLINPGYLGWWVALWTRVDRAIGFSPASWMSASIFSFGAAAIVTLLVSIGHRRHT